MAKRQRRIRHDQQLKRKQLKHEQLMRILVFVIKLALLSIPIWIIVGLNLQFPVFKEVTTGIIYHTLKGLGINAQLNDTALTIPAADGIFTVNLNWVCAGWESMYIFFALVMATDFSLRKKARGMIFLPAIFFINIFRIVFVLLLVNVYGAAYFDALHVAWTFVLAVILLLLWYVWMRKFR
jgi:exosortase/archaeosortase family protein